MEMVRSTADWEIEIGRAVRSARKRVGASQQAVATRANVSLSAVKSLEAGKGSTLRTLISVSRALNLDAGLDRLFVTTAAVSPVAMLRARTALKAGG